MKETSTLLLLTVCFDQDCLLSLEFGFSARLAGQ